MKLNSNTIATRNSAGPNSQRARETVRKFWAWLSITPQLTKLGLHPSRGDKLIERPGDEFARATLAELEMNKAALQLPTYPRYDLLLTLAPTLVEELSVMQAEFDSATPPARPRTTTDSASAG